MTSGFRPKVFLIRKVFWRAEINLQACTNFVSPLFQAFYLLKEEIILLSLVSRCFLFVMKRKSSVKTNYLQPVNCYYWLMCETQDVRESHQFSVVWPLCSRYTEVMREIFIFFNAFFSLRSKESHYAKLLQAVLTLNATSYLNTYLYAHMFCRSEPWNANLAPLGNEVSICQGPLH